MLYNRITAVTKMADLIEQDYTLLGLVTRMGIEQSFGERTILEICTDNGLDTNTFLLLCRVYSDKDFVLSREDFDEIVLADILRYLHLSHDYYLNSALVTLASSIEKLLEPCNDAGRKVIWKFFTDYKNELDKHFEFEEGEVIPYVKELLSGKRRLGFSIDKFEENHSNIDEKLSDLKNIIMKSLPAECDNRLRVNLLSFIYALQKDLVRHTCIEDDVLVPMVRMIENPRRKFVPSQQSGGRSSALQDDELSDREKEILVSVAKGLINKEIAEKHNISINTVITHRKNITRKTGIKTVAGLTVYAILNGLIDINSVE